MINRPAQAASVAILYQALPPPVIGGLRKDAKPGGYSDGGADIAFALMGAGQRVIVEIIGDDGEMLRRDSLRRFADEHGLLMTSIELLREHFLAGAR